MKVSSRIESQLKGPADVAPVIVQLKVPDEKATLELGKSFRVASPPSDRKKNNILLAAACPPEPGRGPGYRYFPNLGILLGTVDHDGLKTLANSAAVEEIAAAPGMMLVREHKREKKCALSRKVAWGLQALGAPALWKAGYIGRGVRVAHLDSGCDGTHPALADAVRKFMFFGERDEEIAGPAFDDDGHGTHTAGTIAGREVKGRSIGMAPGADLYCGKVTGDRNTCATVAQQMDREDRKLVERVLAGMEWAVGLRVHILNMSMGFPGYVDDFLGVTKILRARGVLPVFAIGNDGEGQTRSPGNYLQSLSVGACNEHKRIAPFSGSDWMKQDRGEGAKPYAVPDLVAPGVLVESAMPGGGYCPMAGTSMAAPHISGLAALLWEACPSATVDDIEDVIVRSCNRATGMLPKRAGFGMPDGPAALKLLRETQQAAA